MPKGEKHAAGGTSKAVPKRTVATDADLKALRVTEMYMKGHNLLSIQQKLGITHEHLTKILTTLRSQWKARVDINFDEMMAREVARIDWVENEAIKAWIRSIKNTTTRTVRINYAPAIKFANKARGKKGEEDRQPLDEKLDEMLKSRMVPTSKSKETTKTGAVGESCWLNIINDCVEKRCRIVGIIQETKVVNNNLNLTSWDSIIKVDTVRSSRDAVVDRIAEFENMPPALPSAERLSRNGSLNGNGKH